MSAIHFQPCADSPRAVRRRAALDGLGDAAHWLFAIAHQWRRRQRERAALAALDSRTLADIGMTRGDAEFLINQPFWRE